MHRQSVRACMNFTEEDELLKSVVHPEFPAVVLRDNLRHVHACSELTCVCLSFSK